MGDELTGLLLAARDGDRRALTVFIARTQAEVWRLCAHLVDPDEAEDVAQDVYLRAWRALAGYRAEASARVWLVAIARRACADAVRRRRRRRLTVARVQAAAGRREPLPEETDRVALNELVRRLERGRREAFVLTQVLGLSYWEAATACGCPVGTVRSRVARARGDLLAWLARADGRGVQHG